MIEKEQLHILLIDDDEDDYLITCDFLDEIDSHRFELEWISTYEEGLARINHHKHDVYLIDYRLGLHNGLELLREAIDAGCMAPLILLTGQGDHEVDMEAMQAGAADYLVKDKLSARSLERSMRYAVAQKRSEEALRESEARYRNVSELISDYSYAFKVLPDGQLQREWMTAVSFERITSYTPEEIERNGGWPNIHYVHPDDKEKVLAHWQTILSGHQNDCEYRIITKDGDVRWLSVYGYPKWDNNEQSLTHVYGAVKNITDLKQAEEIRSQLENQLLQAQKMEAIGRLAGGIAHDFNNSLTVVMTCSELLLSRYLEDAMLARKYVEEIKQAGERAAALTRQLLAFSRKQVLQSHLLNLNTHITDLGQMLSRLIGENIELITILGSDLMTVKADPTQLEQVIMNLAINARDAMPQGGKLVIETANVFLDESYTRQHVGLKPGPYVVLAVSDTGVGMDQQTIQHIFEPFFTTKEKGKGTGLGLATVYGIVQQSGGQIVVFSEVGFGTTFKLYLPPSNVKDPIPHTQPQVPIALDGQETLLVVEDDVTVRELMCSILREKGYTILEAANGADALHISQRHHGKIDLLLTDVVMPGISGQELAQRLKQEHPDIKCLYVSGYTNNIIAYHGVVDTHMAVFEKPFTPDALARRVREILDS